MEIHVIGAGMAGLLAANMIGGSNVHVWEAAPSLPNNHSAVLRFRSNIVSEVLGIPFKRVNMLKCAVPWQNPIADALAYSRKVTGVARSDRSLPQGVVSEERYIAPPDFIQRMHARAVALGVKFHFGGHIYIGNVSRWHDIDNYPCISTIPMDVMANMLGVAPELKFPRRSACNVRCNVAGVDAYVSLYLPDSAYAAARVSVTGDEVIAEVPIDLKVYGHMPENMIDDVGGQALNVLGLKAYMTDGFTAHAQQYAKILPIDDRLRKNAMYEMTDRFGVYSLGRFATWRPGLLLDDLVQDVRRIQSWIGGEVSAYDVRKAR